MVVKRFDLLLERTSMSFAMCSDGVQFHLKASKSRKALGYKFRVLKSQRVMNWRPSCWTTVIACISH